MESWWRSDIMISRSVMRRTSKLAENDVRPFLVRMPAEEHQRLRLMSATTGRSMNDLVVRAVSDFLSGVGRDIEFEAASAKVGERYRDVLDKLGDQ
jgi:predicted DNA-binding protein